MVIIVQLVPMMNGGNDLLCNAGDVVWLPMADNGAGADNAAVMR